MRILDEGSRDDVHHEPSWEASLVRISNRHCEEEEGRVRCFCMRGSIASKGVEGRKHW
jgi:hypothetical protein